MFLMTRASTATVWFRSCCGSRRTGGAGSAATRAGTRSSSSSIGSSPRSIDYKLHQVKEKLGGLRYYFRSEVPDPDGWMRALVRTAETRCETTCELCGQRGTRHTNGRAWLKTLCTSCAADLGYDRIGELVNDLTPDHCGVWRVSCYGDGAESFWDLTHAEVTVHGTRHRDAEVLAPPSVMRTWRIRLREGTEIESGLVAAIERVR